ncbi:hypothetical protein [Bordetella genomosp. 13]|uniref:hypothetical protein n=1 Tax=Bordetella genomosp. 13 TaxID=463040 RepID=UPI0016427455|nr:hypothetical protein [Bordetella genomosp. 13]
MHPSAEPPDHEAWLQGASEIRSALSSLTHPSSLVQARDNRGMHWMVKVLGLDVRSRLFFWRPENARIPQGEDLAARLAATPLDFTATAHDGAWLQFQSGRPSVVRFDDGSMLMVSPFPNRLRQEFGAH